jgi:leucyl-tRNA synthetase
VAPGNPQELPVQIDGKLAARIAASPSADEDQVREQALAAVARRLDGRKVARVVLVPGKIVNVVTTHRPKRPP